MLDSFLPIPDAESLPFYPSELKLVVCVLPTVQALLRMPAHDCFRCCEGGREGSPARNVTAANPRRAAVH